jgi:hypothetical protein
MKQKEPAMRSHLGSESERWAVNMRAQMGNYAYEVTKELCAKNEAVVHWSYMVYKVTPTEVLLSHGKDSPSREHAERNARQIIALSIELRSNGGHAELHGGVTMTPPTFFGRPSLVLKLPGSGHAPERRR